MISQSVVIVTGSGRGIGKEIAIRFINLGAKVVIVDLCNAVETAKEIGNKENALGLTIDVSNVKSIYNMIDSAMKFFGTIDILVNNVGICPTTPLEKITEEEWDEVLATNLKSYFFCIQAVSEIMKKQGHGRIINISSVAGRTGSVVAGCHYCASKAGIFGLTKALARLLGPYNITVNAIAPGTITTEMTKDFSKENVEKIVASMPLGKLGQPGYIAEMVVYLTSDAAQWITGATFDVNGGMYMG